MPRFQIQYRGRDLFSIRVPRSGAIYSSEFEQREAAHWDRYKWEEFKELDGEGQSGVVAHYRAHHHLEAVIAHEQQKQANRRKK